MIQIFLGQPGTCSPLLLLQLPHGFNRGQTIETMGQLCGVTATIRAGYAKPYESALSLRQAVSDAGDSF